MEASVMNKTSAARQAKISHFFPPAQSLLQRKCACGNLTIAGGKCAACAKIKSGLQRRLTIGASNDPLEREADRVADQVMAAQPRSSAGSAPPQIPRYTGQAGEETSIVPASVNRVLSCSGTPLEPALRKDMEQRFRYDFSRVRVHSGDAAELSAREVDAHAYTVGHNIVFGAGRSAPATHEGRRLIAHELTHVVQQAGSEKSSANTGSLTLQRQAAQSPQAPKPHTESEGCDPALQADLKAMHHPALEHVDRAIASLAPGWKGMIPANKAAFTQYFDPSGSGQIDDDFVSSVRNKYQMIRSSMRSLRFDCDPGSRTLCGTSQRWCVGGRLMWTCFGNLHVCPTAYQAASPDFKIETIIHESVHNALLTTDRAYSNEAGFKKLSPRGSGFWGSVLNFLGKIPVLGVLFRSLPGNNDTINNPDSYAGYSMQV
jgi:hypothetical protein